ncbi:MAG: sulfatase [Clostridia bacterium]|nr:sulfatase [Clostridia bacterium]
MRSVLFLSDTVNRRFIDLYDAAGVHLPNLARLAQRSAIFENHFVGSAPCMPARRDIMTGRLGFLERNWGPIEAFDYTLQQALATRGIWSHCITDHYHYQEIGGEGYLQRFDSWVMHHGQEIDHGVAQVGRLELPEHLGKLQPQFWYNRQEYAEDENNYPSVKTVTEAADWLEKHHDDDDFLLWVEPFDPHEPFDVPKRWLDEVGDDYEGPLYMWPEYKHLSESGISPEALQHVRHRYAALLLMTDHYLGRLLDVMDRYDMWRDTAFIYTTDHGCMLGEHDCMAKNYMQAYNEVFHIPLLVHLPGDAGAGMRIRALTQNIDIMPTLLELYGVPLSVCPNPLHGKSWLPLLRGEKDSVRDCAIYGYFGKQVNITDGRYTYFRSPVRGNQPLAVYTSLATDIYHYFDAERLRNFDEIGMGRYLKWTDYPVYRYPGHLVKHVRSSSLRYSFLNEWEYRDLLFDLDNDYAQEYDLVETEPETAARMQGLLRQALHAHDAPDEQFVRLRL